MISRRCSNVSRPSIFRQEKYDSSLRPDSFLVNNLLVKYVCTDSILSIKYL